MSTAPRLRSLPDRLRQVALFEAGGLLLITPPFPEYTSGHSCQSGAASAVLTAIFGEDFAFDDATHEDEGLPVRSFPSFNAAAEEAAISRLYGGIHYRFSNEIGLEQGRAVAVHAVALQTEA